MCGGFLINFLVYLIVKKLLVNTLAIDNNFIVQISDMVLSSLIYIALVIIVIIIIIVLLRYLFAVIFIMPTTLEHPADMVTFTRTIVSLY